MEIQSSIQLSQYRPLRYIIELSFYNFCILHPIHWMEIALCLLKYLLLPSDFLHSILNRTIPS